MNARTHYTHRERGEGGTSTVQCQQYFFLKTLLHEDEPEEASGLLAPRANTEASVQWANKYSMLLLRQPGFKSGCSHGTLTPLSLAPTGPSFSPQSFIWD